MSELTILPEGLFFLMNATINTPILNGVGHRQALPVNGNGHHRKAARP
ncbi:MAG: hypothetical protein R2867_31140 [Caldilineaceae bacterium]